MLRKLPSILSYTVGPGHRRESRRGPRRSSLLAPGVTCKISFHQVISPNIVFLMTVMYLDPNSILMQLSGRVCRPHRTSVLIIAVV